MTLEERMTRLEGLYEKVYHDYELLSILIPRLTEILIKYWSASGNHRESIRRALNLFNEEIQQHFKAHFDEKKNWSASKGNYEPF